MVEPYSLQKMGFGSTETMHLMVEAERRAYADRAEHLGDSDFYAVPQIQLVDKAYAKARMEDFRAGRASTSRDIHAGSFAEESPETTHFSVYSKNGMAVSFTTTLNSGYGSGIVVDGAGFLLNNEMDDFSSKPGTPNKYGLTGGEANAIEPKKRMLSSMTPTIVMKDDRPFVLTGSPGGSTIITTVFQVVTNVIDHNMSMADAIASPRFHHQWLPDSIRCEAGFSDRTLTELKKIGHNIPDYHTSVIGDANSIMVLKDQIIGVSDTRSAGGVVSY